MTFWSSQTLEAALPTIFPAGERPRVDCNAITLTVGREIYVSPSWPEKGLFKKSIVLLDPDEGFPVPPGQFGFLQTNERVLIPKDTMGFISFKATYKMMGLVNVSGFHVDPGWHGPLTFAVFNAGPSPVHLKQGMDLFLLWVASLDAPSQKHRTTPLDPDHFLKMVNRVSGPVKSGYDVVAKIEQIDQRLHWIYGALGAFVPLAVGTFLMVLGATRDRQPAIPVIAPPMQPTTTSNQPATLQQGSASDSSSGGATQAPEAQQPPEQKAAPIPAPQKTEAPSPSVQEKK